MPFCKNGYINYDSTIVCTIYSTPKMLHVIAKATDRIRFGELENRHPRSHILKLGLHEAMVPFTDRVSVIVVEENYFVQRPTLDMGQ